MGFGNGYGAIVRFVKGLANGIFYLHSLCQVSYHDYLIDSPSGRDHSECDIQMSNVARWDRGWGGQVENKSIWTDGLIRILYAGVAT